MYASAFIFVFVTVIVPVAQVSAKSLNWATSRSCRAPAATRTTTTRLRYQTTVPNCTPPSTQSTLSTSTTSTSSTRVFPTSRTTTGSASFPTQSSVIRILTDTSWSPLKTIRASTELTASASALKVRLRSGIFAHNLRLFSSLHVTHICVFYVFLRRF